MSLFLAIFYWVVIPVLVLLIARGLFRRVTTSSQKRVVVVGSVAVFLGLLWIAAGEKWWLDYQVRELCAKDGGTKVYETVTLPPEKFNKYGQINFYKPIERENALGSEYEFIEETRYFQKGTPALWRNHYEVVRRSDGMRLGETTIYSRRGGDLPGPWHESSFGCPAQAGERSLLMQIFIKPN